MSRLALMVSILLIFGSPSVGAAKTLGEISGTDGHVDGAGAALHQLAPPPKTVGAAYKTNPPPLASLDHILGSKPDLDDLPLYIRSFEQIVFWPENHLRYPWITKWNRTILIRLKGNIETHHRELLQQVVDDLSRITGIPFDVIEQSDKLSDIALDIIIHMHDRDPIDHNDWFCGLTHPIVNVDGVLVLERMGFSANTDGDGLIECFYEDISQSLGMSGDTALTEESMYRSEAENGRWLRPTWHDVIMLRTLYDQRIKPGMHEDQAMPIVRVIIGELLEELNAGAE